MNNELSRLKVYYGWSMINPIRKKVALSVLFENEIEGSSREKIERHRKRLQHTFYTRKQTTSEAEDAVTQNRILTEYSTFIMDKPFKGDLEAILENNYQADINNVPEQMLIEIKNALREGYFNAYFKNRTV